MNVLKIFILCIFCKNLYSFHIPSIINSNTKLYMKKKEKVFTSNLYIPKTEKQKKYAKYLDNINTKIVLSLGPAGTGKTLFACQKAITQLKKDEINKIIITRPAVTVEEEIGFLPGNIIKKMDPWTKPIFDIFLEYFTKNEIDLMLSNSKIEICPLAFMRGRTFKNTFIIADEMQNSSPNQMKMLTTRLGSNSRLVITGDLKQSDIKNENGLNNFIVKLNNYQINNDVTNLIKLVEFNSEDIERSEVVQKVIEIYDYEKKDIVLNSIEKNQVSINENKNIEKTKINIQTSILENNISHKKNVKTNDAALIPKHYFTHNFDIFFESRDF